MQWDAKEQRAIIENKHSQLINEKIKLNKAEIEHNKLVNDKINQCITQFNKIINKAEYENILINVEYLKNEFLHFLHPEKRLNSQNITLINYIENFIKLRETGEIKNNNYFFSEGTITNYYATLKHLQDYEKENRVKLDFNDITMNFYGSFKNFLIEKKLFDNTINKDIKHLKLFLRHSWKEKLHNNRIFEDRDFKRTEPKKTLKVVLTEDEVEKLYFHDFSDSPVFSKVRDLFILGCCTGLRFSDFNRIKKEHIQGKFLKINTQKTKEDVIIPISPMAKNILEKYNFRLPNMGNTNFNVQIKEVCKEAGIKELVPYLERKNGFMIEKFIEKHKKVSSHAARRTFATNLYLNNMEVEQIMEITGHKTYSAFEKYINIKKEKNAEKASKNPFFNKSPIRKVD